MYHHVVLLRFDQGVSEDAHRRIHDYAERIRATLEGIISFGYCRNLTAAKSTDYPYAIIAAFDSVEAYATYMAAPLHRELAAFSIQYITDIAIQDFETSAGPVGSSDGDEKWRTTRDRLKELLPAEPFDAYYA